MPGPPCRSMKNMRHGGPGIKKLRPLFTGPFEVDHMIGASAVKFHLPPKWRRIHNVFHVSLTKPFFSDPAKPHRTVTSHPPVQWLDGEPLCRVECLLEHLYGGKEGDVRCFAAFRPLLVSGIMDMRRNKTHGNLNGTCLVVMIWSGSIKLRDIFLRYINDDLN